MKRHRIQVDCYAGGKADERPRRLLIDGCVHRVARLLSSSIEELPISRDQRHRFRVITDDGLVLEVVRESDGEWYLE